MLATRPQLPAYDPIQLVGHVLSIDNGMFTVQCDGADWRCARALSCLVEPQIGDEVLVSGPDRHRVFLLAIIARPESTAVTLSVTGDMTIRSEAGAVNVHSAMLTHIHSNQAVKLTAPRHEQENDSASMKIGQMHYLGKQLDAVLGSTDFFSNVIGLMSDSFKSVARLCFRHVKEVDHVRAQTIDYEAEKLTRVHGGYTTLTAQEVMKINGDQIHMS